MFIYNIVSLFIFIYLCIIVSLFIYIKIYTYFHIPSSADIYNHKFGNGIIYIFIYINTDIEGRMPVHAHFPIISTVELETKTDKTIVYQRDSDQPQDLM